MPIRRRLAAVLAVCGLVLTPAQAQQSSQNNERLKQYLKQHPEADANGDGVLTMAEAQAHRQRTRGAQRQPPKVIAPPPTFEDVAYGPDERNKLDFWRAPGDGPHPVVVFIHGGGFVAGDKQQVRTTRNVQQCLDAGVSFAAIIYRFVPDAPLPDILHDSARAIQFLRFKADEWGIDKTKLATYGGSAGAGTSLWLATRDDLADPDSEDPVLRESTRLTAAGLLSTQATYDFTQWTDLVGPWKEEWRRNPNEIAEFFHLPSEDDLNTPAAKVMLKECDMLGWMTPDDAPCYVQTNLPDTDPTDRGQYVHHPKHAKLVKERLDALGIECVLVLPQAGLPAPEESPDVLSFLLQHLGAAN